MTLLCSERCSRRAWHAWPRHIHAKAAQRNVRSNPLLKAHLGDVASRKRVGLACSSESAAQLHHKQLIRLIKDGHLPQESWKET